LPVEWRAINLVNGSCANTLKCHKFWTTIYCFYRLTQFYRANQTEQKLLPAKWMTLHIIHCHIFRYLSHCFLAIGKQYDKLVLHCLSSLCPSVFAIFANCFYAKYLRLTAVSRAIIIVCVCLGYSISAIYIGH